MLPSDRVIHACLRWLQLLRVSSSPQAWNVIRADAKYADLTQTQYATALEWIRATGLLSNADERLSPDCRNLTEAQLKQLLFEGSIDLAQPTWLQDADSLVVDEGDLPADALALAASLGVSDATALLSIRQVHGRADLAERSRVGTAGELGLIAELERAWPGSTVHIAAQHDGFGYDLLLKLSHQEWHLEVKSTTRRGRLSVFLSRHEHEVALRDPNWRLVVVGLDERLAIRAVATVRYHRLVERSPADAFAESRWQSVLHHLTPADLSRGLAFLRPSQHVTECDRLIGGSNDAARPFAWMPID
jgi:hypothetical protein